MQPRQLRFDGIAYPDGISSEPGRLRLMEGAPPDPERQVRFEDDRFLQFPQLRWSLSHMRELVPTVQVARGPGRPSDLRQPGGYQAAVDELLFTDMTGVSRLWADSLGETYTDAILVLHRGRCVYERYAGAGEAHRPHACFSITQSYVATLAATLIHEGVLGEDRLVPYYLPEMAGSAWGDATLRQVLDMQVGLAYSEDHSDPRSPFWDYARAGGLRPRPAGDDGPANLYDFLRVQRKQGDHGVAFAYKSVNTELIAWVMKRVTGVGLAEMLSQRLWSRIGCEDDAYLTLDPSGVALGGAGLNASLRDLARFGELMRRDGDWQGRQVLPAEVVADIRRGADPARFAAAGYSLLPGYSYRNMWWVSHHADGAFEARGVHGQRLYVAPGAELVVARFASHPVASSAANDPITLPAFQALGRMLATGRVAL